MQAELPRPSWLLPSGTRVEKITKTWVLEPGDLGTIVDSGFRPITGLWYYTIRWDGNPGISRGARAEKINVWFKTIKPHDWEDLLELV